MDDGYIARAIYAPENVILSLITALPAIYVEWLRLLINCGEVNGLTKSVVNFIADRKTWFRLNNVVTVEEAFISLICHSTISKVCVFCTAGWWDGGSNRI